jgi:hypothetical protein
MSLIAPQVRQDRQPVTLKIDVRLLTLLKHYAEFIASSPDYILNQALLVAFSSDRDFQDWLAATHPEDRGRLPELTAEQPRAEPVGRLRGRPPAWSKPSVVEPPQAPATPTRETR